MKAKISIIIPVLNDVEHIGKCLDSIFKSSFKNFEIIVIDDGSTDGTASEIKKYPCKLIKLKNMGLSYSRNLGAKKSNANILYFVDSDIVQEKETIKKMVNFLKEHKNAKIISARWHKESLSNGFVPEFLSLFNYNCIIPWLKTKRIYEGYVCVNTGAFMIRKDTFFEVGGFDNRYKKPGGEDYDFSYRISAKYPIYFRPDIIVRHFYKKFFPTVKNTFWRTSEWTRIFWRKKKFEPYGNATSTEALNATIICSALLFFILSFLNSTFIAVSGILFLMYLIISFRMMSYFAKEKNVLFSIKVLLFNSLLYLMKSLGFIYGVFKVIDRK
jgi:glycosyltransferase involved in cell wall biosynthesis